MDFEELVFSQGARTESIHEKISKSEGFFYLDTPHQVCDIRSDAQQWIEWLL